MGGCCYAEFIEKITSYYPDAVIRPISHIPSRVWYRIIPSFSSKLFVALAIQSWDSVESTECFMQRKRDILGTELRYADLRMDKVRDLSLMFLSRRQKCLRYYTPTNFGADFAGAISLSRNSQFGLDRNHLFVVSIRDQSSQQSRIVFLRPSKNRRGNERVWEKCCATLLRKMASSS